MNKIHRLLDTLYYLHKTARNIDRELLTIKTDLSTVGRMPAVSRMIDEARALTQESGRKIHGALKRVQNGEEVS